MKRKIFPIVLALVLATIGFTGCAKTQEEIPLPEPIESTEPSLPPEFFLDSDGDGFNDWFETNIAHYDPEIPNDRYFIFYYRVLDMPEDAERFGVNLPIQFLLEKGEVPPENIIKLTQGEATDSALKDAIDQVAERADISDLVYLQISTHGSATGFNTGGERLEYAVLDEWLKQIEAKVLIVSLSACGSEKAAPMLGEGSCPRIIYLYAGGWFIHALGLNLDYFERADGDYGNNDGYLSIGELADCLDDVGNYGSDWNILRQRKRMYVEGNFVEAEGYHYSGMIDDFNIAYQIYLTDLTHDDLDE